jgi:ferritin-like metal-binding protein YciE
MSDTMDAVRTAYVTGLRNQHAVENQAIELLERQVGRLQHYPDMEARMREHIAESRAQSQRLEALLSELGTSQSTVKDTVMSFVGNMAALMHAPAPDEVIKNTFANFAFEHFEITKKKQWRAGSMTTSPAQPRCMCPDFLRERQQAASAA